MEAEIVPQLTESKYREISTRWKLQVLYGEVLNDFFDSRYVLWIFFVIFPISFFQLFLSWSEFLQNKSDLMRTKVPLVHAIRRLDQWR